MSVTARQFAAGILYHAAEICAVTDQYVNSYKRLWGGNEAPSYICWGHNNRSALLRIPQYKPGKGNSARMEFRALDPVATIPRIFGALGSSLDASTSRRSWASRPATTCGSLPMRNGRPWASSHCRSLLTRR